jgi:hypothetical protein
MIGMYEKLYDLVAALASARDVEASLGIAPQFDDPEGNYGSVRSQADGYSVALVNARLLPRRLLKSGFVAGGAHLYPAGRDDYGNFNDLPSGLEFGMSRDRVYKCLGTPTSTGGGGFGRNSSPRWSLHKADACVLHIEYDKALSVSFVTLMNPAAR